MPTKRTDLNQPILEKSWLLYLKLGNMCIIRRPGRMKMIYPSSYAEYARFYCHFEYLSVLTTKTY